MPRKVNRQLPDEEVVPKLLVLVLALKAHQLKEVVDAVACLRR
jgi:hypothetical protein